MNAIHAVAVVEEVNVVAFRAVQRVIALPASNAIRRVRTEHDLGFLGARKIEASIDQIASG